MKNAKSLLIPSLSFGLLAKALIISQALSFTTYIDNVTPPGNDYAIGALSGPNTVSGLQPFTNVLNPNNGGLGKSYGIPTGIVFGTTQTSGGNPLVPTNQATFGGPGDPNAVVQFTFALQNGSHSGSLAPDSSVGAFGEFLITGYVTGDVGYSGGVEFSTATLRLTSFQRVDPNDPTIVLATAVPGLDPNPGLGGASLQALTLHTDIGSQTYNIFLDTQRLTSSGVANGIPVPAPASGDQFSIEGYVTAVPEPGSVALLLGMGVTGSALLMRRRRK